MTLGTGVGTTVVRTRILCTTTFSPAFRILSCGVLVALFAALSLAQTNSYQRIFPQSKAAVEKALAALQPSMAGHLPVLEGFAKPGEHPLDRYQRAYYQSTAQVSSNPSGGSTVRITTKVTAWYSDSVASHSGYQLLTSNGRLESDVLDQLTEQLAKGQTGNGSQSAANAPQQSSEPTASAEPTITQPAVAQPSISAPSPRFPDTGRTFSSSLSQGLASRNGAEPSAPAGAEKSKNPAQAEVESLEAILKNTGHPKNLVAVKKSGTPVVSNPSLTAKPQFLASMHDEFEMLDYNADWVHVRISGLSRGWIWRNSVEMPDGIRDTDVPPAAAALTPAADLFRVAREEASTFPGDWAPLKNKNVKIISVQKIDDNAKDAGAKARLEYAKFLFEKGYKEMAQKPQDLAGIVVIFDSADGGMVAATLATLQQWKVGTLSDSAFWHQCFFDPPELSDSAGSSASQ
jgi:hypothetical protein